MKKFKKLIIHVIVWVLFILLLNNKTFDLEWGAFDRKGGSLLIPLLYGIAFGAFIFYINTNYYIPKYFGKEKKSKYWLLATLLLLGVSVLETIIDVVYLVYQNYELAKVQFKEESITALFPWLFMVLVSAFIPNILCWILAFAFRLPKDWIISERQKNQLEKDKLSSELGFLKAQINPHFLFNGINSIYHLIGEDDAMAKNTLLQFSGLLRYQLYECSVDYISIEKELDYINNYINIEKVRKGEDAVFTFKLPNVKDNSIIKKFKIAPLLISPFLENAFKYLSHFSNREKNFITLNLTITKAGILTMDLSNSYDNTFKIKEDSSGGIGLENVKRRMQILYPDKKHQMNISKDGNIFLVNLILDINED